MQNEHHNLALEFPEYKERVHELKMSNSHFRRLMDEHHELDREIRRAETNQHGISDEHLEDLKKKRLALKDECYKMLTAEEA